MFETIQIRRRLLAQSVIALLVLGLAGPSLADDETRFFQDQVGAIRGYDPVAYFEAGQAAKGDDRFTAEYEGAIWKFVSAANRDRFAAMPEQYVPQFGGYCAWAMSRGYLASTDPTAWKIVDDKLYLNYSHGVQSRWSNDIPGNIRKGNANWPEFEPRLLR